ncbi:hypothetical protein P4B20_15650 [Pseudomonas aeruginosa]|uniref:hypothetical protein n=1 Tax=Pseudomonas aeruginosa TaxID=287 RepID=UPI00283AA79E|nr:hypothetical protein [Pseudomonas aeruginosa]WMU33906.1 hypothetical protein P4B20_15650 [Pseudomonas aeruginosa]
MRKGAELAQTLPPEWVERLNQALFSSPEDAKLLEDPVILAACRRANRAELLHWANANLQRPGEPVQPYVSADMVDTARELARRGLSELLMNVARSTQNTAWELWMKMAFNLTQDPRVLEEFLEVSSRSISEFIDSNMRVVTQIILEEKSAQAHDDPRSTNEAWSVGCSRAGMWIRSNSAGGWATAFSRSTTPAWSGAKARTPRSAFWRMWRVPWRNSRARRRR